MDRNVTIIGAGSTGLSAGIFLDSYGYRPKIIEKRERRKITKAIGINPVTLSLFEKSGITHRFISNGWKLECMNFWYQNDLIYKSQFAKIKHAYPFMIVQPQFETEQILEDYLNEKGIEIERKVELLNISDSGNFLKLDLKNLNDNTNYDLETDGIIIGADGSKSKVRDEIGYKMKGWEHPDQYTLYDIELETPVDHKEGHYRFHKEGVMIMLHISDGVWRVGGNITDMLNYLPKGTKIGKTSWKADFTISEKIAEKFSLGNVHIIGDAAHVHSPLGAKGMNMCIEDSYIFSKLFEQNREVEFSNIRRKQISSTVGILGQLTELAGGQTFVGQKVRESMKPFSFLFPVLMPYMRNFLLGL